jgi:hypothetical protein
MHTIVWQKFLLALLFRWLCFLLRRYTFMDAAFFCTHIRTSCIVSVKAMIFLKFAAC